MVYILFPLGVLFLLHFAWSVKTWWSGRGFLHVAVDTYRDVTLLRSLVALHTYASLFYPCHVRCAVLHSLQAICHMTTWTTILLVLMDRLGTESETLRAMCVLLTLLMAQVLKPAMNMLGFYYRLEDAEDGYTAAMDGMLTDALGMSMRSTRTTDQKERSGQRDVGEEDDAIDFEMDDKEWEVYRADRSQLFQERIREEDIDIAEDHQDGYDTAGRIIQSPVKNGGHASGDDNDVEIAFDDEDEGAGASDATAPDEQGGRPQEETFSILTLTGDRIGVPGPVDDNDIVAARTRHHDAKVERPRESKQERRERRKREATAAAAAAADTTKPRGKGTYGFGELDNFVLFHDDYTSFQNRGHQLRLEQYADDHANDNLVAISSTSQVTSAKDAAKTVSDLSGDVVEHDSTNHGDGITRRSQDDGDDQRTLTSSCVSIEVDDDDDGNNGGGIFALGPLATLGAGGEDRDDNEVSISDPRILRTLHYPYFVVLVAVIAVDLWVVVGWYRNESSVCSSWVFTLWWITWLVDAVVCETLYLLAVVMFRYLIREPHEEDIHGRARRYFDGIGGKRDLRWWRGNLLHPYEGETRYR
jgi:hypothetical protein